MSWVPLFQVGDLVRPNAMAPHVYYYVGDDELFEDGSFKENSDRARRSMVQGEIVALLPSQYGYKVRDITGQTHSFQEKALELDNYIIEEESS